MSEQGYQAAQVYKTDAVITQVIQTIQDAAIILEPRTQSPDLIPPSDLFITIPAMRHALKSSRSALAGAGC